jgi:hypothetical protein
VVPRDAASVERVRSLLRKQHLTGHLTRGSRLGASLLVPLTERRGDRRRA